MSIKLKTVLRSMRLPFLILTPACVFLGISTVIAGHVEPGLLPMLLVLCGALLAHVSVNMLNEYFDFRSGLDLVTLRTAFSGGSGALPDYPEMHRLVLYTGGAALFAMLLIGGFFIWQYGAGIVPIGITGLLLILTYTGWINKHPFLCLIAPGIGFGFLMVAGTQFVLSGEYTLLSWLVAVIPFFLVNNLLLLNQYPDIEADARAGRKHFPVAYGVERSTMVYGFFVLLTILAIIIYILLQFLPVLSLIALLPMPLAFFARSGAKKYGPDIGYHPQYLAANVAVTILTPLLLAISIIAG